MSIKNSLIFLSAACAVFSASTIFAGGVEIPLEPEFIPYLYAEANVGYAYVNWKRFPDPIYPFLRTYPARPENKGDGFVYGFDGGFAFARNFAVEIAWFDLPNASGQGSGLFPYGFGSLRVNSWFTYAAAKLMVPIYSRFDVFGKVGGAYRDINYHGIAAPRSTNAYWTPVFAAGIEFGWNHWALNAQYLRLPGYREARPITQRAPAANLYTVGIGYELSL
jgi:hypothetical protein